MKNFWKVLLLVFAVSTVAVGSYVIPDLGVTTRKLANLAVTTAKLADSSVNTNKIVSNTIVGGNVASSINLPGNTVQENGLNVAVSSTNAASSLKIIRGTVNNAGSILSGEGFTVSHTITGQYNIFFSSAFASNPSFSAVSFGGAGCIGFDTLTTSNVNIITATCGGGATNNTFSFTVIGPR